MENENNKEKSFEDFGEYKKEEKLKPIVDEIKKVHGNTGKKKNYTPEQLANKSAKMKAAWARKKAQN